tara:strand:+ start:1260 stop:1637 length:378 start_codon:yes stop_codon:yes gene_type:complete
MLNEFDDTNHECARVPCVSPKEASIPTPLRDLILILNVLVQLEHYFEQRALTHVPVPIIRARGERFPQCEEHVFVDLLGKWRYSAIKSIRSRHAVEEIGDQLWSPVVLTAAAAAATAAAAPARGS